MRKPSPPLTLIWPAFAVLILIFGVLTGGRLRTKPPAAYAQSPADDSLLLELAERLLGLPFPSQNAATVKLLPGAVPDNLPIAVPMPAGSRLIGSQVRPTAGVSVPMIGGPGGFQSSPPSSSGMRVEVVLDVPASPGDVNNFYKSAMDALGWYVQSGPPFFVPSPIGGASQALSFCQSTSGPWVQILTRPIDNGPTDVRFIFDSGFTSPCANPVPGVPTAFGPPGFGILPSLKPPANATVRSTGGGGSNTRFTSDATAITDMSVSDLATFYADQLTAAGWSRIDSGTAGSLAWSTWSIPDHSDLQGFLYVRDGPAAGQRSLHLEGASTDPNASSSSFFGSGVPVSGVVQPISPLPPSPATPTSTPTTSP
jgi:hypothetical protein